MPRIDLIKLRRGTEAEWESVNPTLADGEYGYEKDTKRSKIGDGSTAWNDLDYLDVPTASSLPPIENVYADIAVMLANQGSQTTGFLQEVTDASADPNIESGTWFYKKKASSTGTLATDYTPLNQGQVTALLYSQGKQTADCGTVIPLDTVYGHFCNLQSANNNTSFTIDNQNIVGSYAVVLVNASSEPTITGATQQGGIDFIADTDLEVLIQNRGDAGVVYSFNPVSVGAVEADTLQSVTERGGITDQNMQILSETPSFIVSESTTLENSFAEIAADVNTGYLDFGNSDGHIARFRPLNMGKSVDINFAGEDGDLTIYSGTWNASTNSPALANTDTGVKAVEYKVSVAGTQDFGAGDITFAVGDIVANDGNIWYKKVDNNQSFGISTGIINLKDYGAVGDGVTDDTDAIASAFLDLVSNDYDALFVPKGTYITQAIGQNSTVPAYSGIGALSGKLIYGEGQFSIFKLKAGENTELFEWQFNTSAIKDIRFDGNNPTPAWGGALNNPNTDYLVKIRGYGIDLENVVAQYSGGDGIHIYGGVGVVDIRGANSKSWFNWGYGYVIERCVACRMTSPWVEQNLLGGVFVTTTVTGTDNTYRQLNNIVIENLYYERVSSFPTDWVATYGQPKVVTIDGTNGVRVINPAFVLAPDDIHWYVKANTSSPAGYQGSNGNILELGAHSNINAVFDEQCNNNTIIRKSVTPTNGAINVTDNGNNNQVKWNLIENAISLKNDSDATVYGANTNFAYATLSNAELKDGGFFDDNSDYHATSTAAKYVQLNPTLSTTGSANLYNNADLPINGNYYVILVAKMSGNGRSYIALQDALTNQFYNFETKTFGVNSPYYFKTDPSVNYYAIPFETDGQNRKVRITVYSSLTAEKSYLYHAFVADSKDVHLELKRSNVVIRKGEVKQATTAQLPPAANVRAGTEVYDTTTNQLLYNNGSTWISGGVSEPLLLSDGTASNATYSFGSDADVGIYRPAVNTLGLTGGGVVARWSSTGFRSESIGDFYIRKAGSTAAAPMYSFWGSYDNTGMFRPVGLNEVAFSANGVERFRVGISRNTHTIPFKPASYTVATLPTGAEGDVAYVTDADTISYRATAVGGGTGKALVFFDGTNWIYH